MLEVIYSLNFNRWSQCEWRCIKSCEECKSKEINAISCWIAIIFHYSNKNSPVYNLALISLISKVFPKDKRSRTEDRCSRNILALPHLLLIATGGGSDVGYQATARRARSTDACAYESCYWSGWWADGGTQKGYSGHHILWRWTGLPPLLFITTAELTHLPSVSIPR
jgi:hypothetical protein